ncbi:hypothetical protein B0J14DRAFT_637831 [Halenospora varia]|nr:hypothetical protein B0J14DRAFT_637831 [Halenospora varia]
MSVPSMPEASAKGEANVQNNSQSPRKNGRTLSKDGAKSRSAHGCWTCRLRRKKCDETGPECIVCRERGLQCAGFAAVKPRWMDGGARQEAVHQEIKATVASVTRMKRMMKLVQSREKASPPRRSVSIPPEFLANNRSLINLQEDCYSSSASRATSLGPSSLVSTNPLEYQPWCPEPAIPWTDSQNGHLLPVHFGANNSEFADKWLENPIDGSQFSAESFNSGIIPTLLPQYFTSEPESFKTGCDDFREAPYVSPWSNPVYPPSPAISTTVPDSTTSLKQFTPNRLSALSACEDARSTAPFFEKHVHPIYHSHKSSPLSPVSENSSIWSSQQYRLPSPPPLSAPEFSWAEHHEGIFQTSLQTSNLTGMSAPTSCSPEERQNPGFKTQRLRDVANKIARQKELLTMSTSPNWRSTLSEAVSSILEIREEYLAACESLNHSILSDIELSSLAESIRTVLWIDIVTRTFEATEAVSPFRGHITRMLSASDNILHPATRRDEDWILTGIESVTRLAQVKTMLSNQNSVDMEELKRHENDVLTNLEYQKGIGEPLAFDTASSAKGQRRTVFLHAMMIYYHVVTQGPFSETAEIRKSVNIVFKNLVALNDPYMLATEMIWPFLVASCMAGSEHHQIVCGLYQDAMASTGSSSPRLVHAFRIVQECWGLRSQGINLDWRNSLANMKMLGYEDNFGCW